MQIYDRVRYLTSGESGIRYSISHNVTSISIDSYNSLPIEKRLAFQNVIILINSVVDENKSNYYYNIFLEKGFYEDKSYTQVL